MKEGQRSLTRPNVIASLERAKLSQSCSKKVADGRARLEVLEEFKRVQP